MPVPRTTNGWLAYYLAGFQSTLQERITAVVQAIAADMKKLKSQVDVAAGAWPLLDADPTSPEPGYPWLLLADVVTPLPVAMRSGFNRLVVVPAPVLESAVLSVKTTSGQIARFAAASLE